MWTSKCYIPWVGKLSAPPISSQTFPVWISWRQCTTPNTPREPRLRAWSRFAIHLTLNAFFLCPMRSRWKAKTTRFKPTHVPWRKATTTYNRHTFEAPKHTKISVGFRYVYLIPFFLFLFFRFVDTHLWSMHDSPFLSYFLSSTVEFYLNRWHAPYSQWKKKMQPILENGC